MKNLDEAKQLAQEQANIKKEVFVVVRHCEAGDQYGHYSVMSQKEVVELLEDCGKYFELEETVFWQPPVNDHFAPDVNLNVIEITTALRSIIRVDENVILCNSKFGADMLSYILHRADVKAGEVKPVDLEQIFWTVKK